MSEEILEVKTIPAKYIYLDVVDFIVDRSVEAQSDILRALNEIVNASLHEHLIPEDKLILLPTGDGLCIALLNVEVPFDLHLLIALSILRRVHEHNERIDNARQKFQVRIGLNDGTDNLVTDINGNLNIAGQGINMASRVMNFADGSQIFAGYTTFEILHIREKYTGSFKAYQGTVANGSFISVYQFVREGHAGLNTSTATVFQSLEKVEPLSASKPQDNSIVMSFDFPEEVRVPCEQYLLYFGKFLQDLGVRTTSDLEHNAGQVLFTITPADSQTALDKIRTALDIYLQLPSSRVSDSTHAEIAIHRLESTLHRVKSDFKLVVAELQAKNATIQAHELTIQAHELTINIQKGLLSGEIIFDSIKNVTPKTEDKEELLGGIVSLAAYKDKGVEINLAELYRKLKGLFKED